MSSTFPTLRARLESELARRIPAPFDYRDRTDVQTVSSGIPEMDALTGGFPRGALTEICGPACSGRTSLLLSALAARTAEGEMCALIDGRDALDPDSAQAAGVELKRLLWIRCRSINQVLRATDLLIQAGGFGFIAVDLSDFSPRIVRHIPLNLWFRFRRAVEDTPTILTVVEQESNAKTCASLVLQFQTNTAQWSETPRGAIRAGRHSLACLLEGMSVCVEVLRCRAKVKPVIEIRRTVGIADPPGTFTTKTIWNLPALLPLRLSAEKVL